MADESGFSRRTFVGAGAATVATLAVSDLLHISSAIASTGPKSGIGYFSRFGVTDKLIKDTLGAALSKGGEYADIFFQHRVTNNMVLEDGSVNRAFANVGLGVGVRVVRGDQTG